jgi:hypothetical protein
MSAPLRIVPFIGGLLFIALALGIVLPPLFDLLNDGSPLEQLGGTIGVILMLLFFGAAPAFVGVRLIRHATRSRSHTGADTPPMTTAPAIAEAPTTPPASPPPPPPSVRRVREAERAVRTAASSDGSRASSWPDRLRTLSGSSLGLAVLVGAISIPCMVLRRDGGAYVATIALTLYAIFEIGRSTVGRSWFLSALTSAGTGMMLFIVLAATAGAIEQGEGNNPVFVLPGMLFYVGIGLTGIARLFSRR